MRCTVVTFASAAAFMVSAMAQSNSSYSTELVTDTTYVCPAATTLALGNTTYVVTEATTLTISNCPCTLTHGVPSPAAATATAPAILSANTAASVYSNSSTAGSPNYSIPGPVASPVAGSSSRGSAGAGAGAEPVATTFAGSAAHKGMVLDWVWGVGMLVVMGLVGVMGAVGGVL